MSHRPVDVHVGQRLRERRILLGLSQQALAEAIGLTFQQVQKYERGANRMGASRLWEIAQHLDVPVSFFFDGLRHEPRPLAAPPPELTRRDLELAKAWARIPEGAIKDHLYKLVTAHAGPARAAGGRCRVCGCTEDRACLDAWGDPCAWAEPDLCTACAAGPADPGAGRVGLAAE